MRNARRAHEAAHWLPARVVSDERMVPAKQPLIGAQERSIMMRRRRDDQPVGWIVWQSRQADGSDSDVAVNGKLKEPGRE